jgi:uncharacterized protein YfaS (alpha-2-macroglobulin family)
VFGRAFCSSLAFAAFVSVGCASHTAPANTSSVAAPATATAVPTALPAVTAPPANQTPPPWIVEISPTKEAPVGAQIRIRFANDVVPVEALEAPDRQAALAKVEIEPKVPGRFTFVTPRMIAFSAERALPPASRIVVIVHAGLQDLKGNTLDHDLAYTFTTTAPVIYFPGAQPSPAPQGPRPRMVLQSNVALDEKSLQKHASLRAPDGTSIPLVIVHGASPSPAATATPEGDTSFDAEQSFAYALAPEHDVPLATTYEARIDAGVAPALGNLPAQDASERVITYGPFSFKNISLDTTAANRPFVTGNPILTFANAVDDTSIADAITLTPAAKPGFDLAGSTAPNAIGINANALAPDTTYTVHIAHTLKDMFGQTLAHNATTTFKTGDLAPELWAAGGFAIFPATLSVALDVSTANLPGNAYRARYRRMEPHDVVSDDVNNQNDLTDVLGKDEAWPSVAAPHTRNVEATTQVPLAQALGGATGLVAYGVADDFPDAGAGINHELITGAVQITNVGVFAQWFPTGGYVRAQHLSDGSPIAIAAVEVYESKPAPADAAQGPCASGHTDATGTLVFAKSAFERCLSAAKQDDQAPALVAIVHDRSDWAFVRTDVYGQELGESVSAAWSAGMPHALGTVISDRQLYQRGETAYFTAFGFFETAGAIVHGSSAVYTVVAKSPQGKTIALGTHALDAFGSFDVQTTIPSDADLGDWDITATGTGGESMSGTFTVAQFKPPTFKVALSLDAATAVAGDTVHATTKSAYLFGAPLANGSEHINVTREQSSFTPKGFESFHYGPQYEYPEEPPTLDADVSESDITTAADGTTNVPIPVATDLPFPADYRVDGEVKDVSNLAVSDSQTFTALPSRDLVVLRGDFFGTANKSYDFDFAVVDPSGKQQSGKTVHFTLQRRVYDTATQLVEGSEAARDAVHYETVQEFDATANGAIQKLHALPDKGGEYRLRANLPHTASEATATDLTLFVLGPDASWYRSDDTTLQVKLDKDTYKPGDVAHALVASPYDDAELFFAVIRNGMLMHETLRVKGASVSVPFTITPAMLPNVAVEAVLVRRGPPIGPSDAKKIVQLSREGFASVHVALDSKYVNVVAKPQLLSIGPGETQHVALRVSDVSGKPLSGEITVAVANDAVLQLSGYRFPDLVKQIYSDLPISTRYADNRGDVKLETEHRFLPKGFGYGGGEMAGPAGTRVRTQFRPIAFFDGSVKTDANGNATVAFQLPDDLTTWRVLALARTKDARFGITDATFVATKPLVTTAILPQFARPGDLLEGGVSVTNVSAVKPGTDPGDIDIAGSLAGPLAFASPPAQRATTKTHFDGPTAGYRFAMLVTAARDAANDRALPDATLTFRTTLANASDAFRVTLPIVTDDVLESVVTTGTTADSASVPLAIDPALPSDAGGLHVTLASTLLGDTLTPLDAALANDGPPFGYESAARIAIAADRIVLERRYGMTSDIPQLEKKIAAERAALHTLARDDGSYAFYPGGSGDPFTTAFVAIQLVQAKNAGIDVSDDLAKIHANLLAILADPTRGESSCIEALCKFKTRLEMLETLGRMGDVRSDHLSDIYDERKDLSYYERVELARHLVRLPDWRAQGIALRDELLEQLYETGRFAGLVQENDFGESPIDGESQLLGLMIETGIAPDRIDRAFNSLLAARGHDGTWGCACDDAEAMNAIVLYAAQDHTTPNFTAAAQLGGGEAFAQQFEGYKLTQVTHDTPMAAVPRGNVTLALRKQGTGTLHYTVDLDYAIRGAAPGAYQGIRIDRIVRPAGATGDPIATFGLAQPTGPLTIDAGNVYDIEDRITTDHELEGLVVEDSLAAGLEAIDTRFATNSSRIFESVADWNIDYQTIERNRVVTYARNVQPGVYAFHYLVRSVTPGTFSWPPAKASLALAPDEFGRTAAGTLVIK